MRDFADFQEIIIFWAGSTTLAEYQVIPMEYLWFREAFRPKTHLHNKSGIPLIFVNFQEDMNFM